MPRKLDQIDCKELRQTNSFRCIYIYIFFICDFCLLLKKIGLIILFLLFSIQLFNDPQEIEAITGMDINGIPPALPEKRSKRRKERLPSQYDNVPENEHLSTCSLHGSTGDSPDAGKPPPLPLKKRHSKYRNNLR